MIGDKHAAILVINRQSLPKNNADPPLLDDEPPSFSLAGSVTKDEASVRERFPRISEAARLVADIQAGEMLYLPTGWFHEVQSFSSGDGSDKSGMGLVALGFYAPY